MRWLDESIIEANTIFRGHPVRSQKPPWRFQKLFFLPHNSLFYRGIAERLPLCPIVLAQLLPCEVLNRDEK
jgi:hypothetical protein